MGTRKRAELDAAYEEYGRAVDAAWAAWSEKKRLLDERLAMFTTERDLAVADAAAKLHAVRGY